MATSFFSNTTAWAQRHAQMICIGAILLAALVLLLPFLSVRPIHHDEAVNGWFLAQLWKTGYYKYDPANYHGPLFFYLLQLAETFVGYGIVGMRLVGAIFATASCYVVALHSRWFGRSAYFAAAALLCSPAFIYYSRYAHHEPVYIFFQICFSYGFWNCKFEGGRHSLIWLTVGLVGMLLTKETWIIFIGTWAIALGCTTSYQALFPAICRPESILNARRSFGGWRSAAAIGICGLSLIAIFYSGFFLNPSGVIDLFRSMSLWVQTGVDGGGHQKPFYYWCVLIATHEPITLIAIVGSPALLFNFSYSRRFWPVFALGILLAYSIVPYKTPMSMPNLIWPYAMVIGIEIDRLLQWQTKSLWKKYTIRAMALASLTAGGTMLVYDVWLNLYGFDDSKQAYSYVQTRKQINELAAVIQTASQQIPAGRNMRICVKCEDTWPFPWLFARYPNVEWDCAGRSGYQVLIVDRKHQRQIESRFSVSYVRLSVNVRHAREPVFAYFRLPEFSMLANDARARVVQPEPSGKPVQQSDHSQTGKARKATQALKMFIDKIQQSRPKN